MRVSQLLLSVLAMLALALTSATASALASTSRAGSGQRRHAQTPRRSVRRGANVSRAVVATQGSGGAGIDSGTPAASTPAHPTVTGDVARIIHGEAFAPSDAPLAVQEAIWAGDAIRHKPYVYGGGHGTWNDTGYDCSGSVSYILHAAGLIRVSMDSVDFESWGQSGAGQWITVYTNDGHAFVQIAGIRLDTSSEQDPGAPTGSGPRWRPLMTNTSGYMARHLLGL